MAIINGTAGADVLVGTALDDTIAGGAGNDTMTGDAGADTFVLEFGQRVVAGGSMSFAQWLEDEGYEPLEDGETTQAQFSTRYNAFLAAVVEHFAIGHDADMDGTIEVGLNQNDEDGTPYIEGATQAQLHAMWGERESLDVVTGNHTQTRFYSDTITVEGRTVFSGTGDDVITDFNPAEGDRLLVNGIAPEDLPDFLMRVADVDGDGDLDTEFLLQTDGTWSVRLLGHASFNVDRDVSGLPGVLLTGTAGNDTLTGGEGDDTLMGLAGNDILDGMDGDDDVEGGEGADTMTGGDGADSFMFDFGDLGVAAGTSSFAQWRAEHGMAPLADGVTTQGEFSSSYSHWLEHLVEAFSLGHDADLDGEVEVGLNQNDETGTPIIEGMTQAELDALFGERESLDVVTGNHTQTRFYSDAFEIEARAVFSGSGRDVITDFNPLEGDRLFVGDAQADLTNFLMRVADVDANGTVDTQFLLTTDPNWSVTLTGYAAFTVGDVVLV